MLKIFASDAGVFFPPLTVAQRFDLHEIFHFSWGEDAVVVFVSSEQDLLTLVWTRKSRWRKRTKPIKHSFCYTYSPSIGDKPAYPFLGSMDVRSSFYSLFVLSFLHLV